jgi:hypothetical protein
MNTAYVYKWTHIPTYRWYIGSRTNKNAHPDDGYLCSSKIVKPMILNNPEEWKREILFVGSPFDAYEYESELLDMFDARNDERSFNQHNNEGKKSPYGTISPNKGKSPSLETREKLSIAGKKRTLSEKHKENISKALSGKIRSKEHCNNISESKKGSTMHPNTREGILKANTGRKLSEEHIQKLSERSKGNTYNLGKKHSDETKKKMSESAKGKKKSAEHIMKMKEKIVCPHCDKVGGKLIMPRYHFDNCKYKEKSI